MGMPDKAVVLSPEQVAELSKSLGLMRHNINNNLALIVAASELIKRKPEMAHRFIENICQQPDRISAELRAFTSGFEAAVGIEREHTTAFSKPQAPA